MIFSNEVLVGENEGVLRCARVLVKTTADPGLLIANRVTVVITVTGCDVLAGCHPVVEDDKTGVVTILTVIKRVAHTGQVRANQGRAAEMLSQRL